MDLKTYYKPISKEFQYLQTGCKDRGLQNIGFIKAKWEESRFQERLMRCGGEVGYFNIEMSDTAQLEELVNFTLMEDWVKRTKEYLKNCI